MSLFPGHPRPGALLLGEVVAEAAVGRREAARADAPVFLRHAIRELEREVRAGIARLRGRVGLAVGDVQQRVRIGIARSRGRRAAGVGVAAALEVIARLVGRPVVAVAPSGEEGGGQAVGGAARFVLVAGILAAVDRHAAGHERARARIVAGRLRRVVGGLRFGYRSRTDRQAGGVLRLRAAVRGVVHGVLHVLGGRAPPVRGVGARLVVAGDVAAGRRVAVAVGQRAAGALLLAPVGGGQRVGGQRAGFGVPEVRSRPLVGERAGLGLARRVGVVFPIAVGAGRAEVVKGAVLGLVGGGVAGRGAAEGGGAGFDASGGGERAVVVEAQAGLARVIVGGRCRADRSARDERHAGGDGLVVGFAPPAVAERRLVVAERAVAGGARRAAGGAAVLPTGGRGQVELVARIIAAGGGELPAVVDRRRRAGRDAIAEAVAAGVAGGLAMPAAGITGFGGVFAGRAVIRAVLGEVGIGAPPGSLRRIKALARLAEAGAAAGGGDSFISFIAFESITC